jgi:hypothetical protein
MVPFSSSYCIQQRQYFASIRFFVPGTNLPDRQKHNKSCNFHLHAVLNKTTFFLGSSLPGEDKQWQMVPFSSSYHIQ